MANVVRRRCECDGCRERRRLSYWGRELVKARHADEAWFILYERSEIGVLLIDDDMPGSMCGVTLAACVRENRPCIEVVLTSERQRFSNLDMPDQGLFVSRPYDASQIFPAIHQSI